MLLALVPAALVIAQPDLGSGLVYVVDPRWRCCSSPARRGGTSLGLFALFAVAVALVLVAAPAARRRRAQAYQKDRLTSFLHPSDNPGDAGYQQNQSRSPSAPARRPAAAIGRRRPSSTSCPSTTPTSSSRWSASARASSARRSCSRSTRCSIWRGLRILTMAKNLFGALIAGGIVAMLMFQVFVNVGMNIGIMPITGIPLPLMSYGGSSVLTTLLAIGLLQSIYAQGTRPSAAQGPRPHH